MAVERAVTFDIRADISNLSQQLSEIPGIGKEAAKDLIKELRTTVRAAAKQNNSAIRQMEREWDRRLSKVRTGAEKVFGGIVGDVLDVREGFLALSKPLQAASLAMGGVGVAAIGAVAGATALTAAVAGIATAAIKAGKSAEEAIEELKGFGEFAGIARGQEAAIRSFNQQIEATGKIIKATGVIIFTEFAPYLEQMAFVALKSSLVLKDLFERMADARDIAADAGTAIKSGVISALGALSPTLGAAAVALDGLGIASKRQVDVTGALDDATQSYDERARQMLATAKAANAAKMVGNPLLKDEADAVEKVKTKTAELNEELRGQIEYRRQLQDVMAKTAQMEEEILDDIDARIDADMKNIADLQASSAANAKELARNVAVSIAGSLSDMTQLLSSLAADAYENSASKIDALKEQLADGAEDLTKEEKKQLKQRIKAEKEAAKISFAQKKATAIATAIINGALAVVSALTLPPPAGQIAAAVTGAATAAEIAKIASEKPKFHTGRAPDEMGATLTRNEAVLDPRATRAMGSQAIRDMNRGIGGHSATELRVSIAGRDLDAAVERVSRSGGRLQRRIDSNRRIGSVNPYSTDR